MGREIILTGELCSTKAAAWKAIEATRTNAAMERRYQRRVSRSSGRPYFVLRSANHELLATSKIYASALERNRAITALKAQARHALVEDETHPRALQFAERPGSLTRTG